MKNQTRAKIGGRRGNPGYRTPSGWRYRQALKVCKYKKHEN